MHRAIAGCCALVLMVSCDKVATVVKNARSHRYVNTDSMGVAVSDIATIAAPDTAELTENSGVAMSVRQPGILFSINDSDNEPLLFAMDTLGARRGVWRLTGATNVDWEAVSVGPCPKVRDCVYVGDTGDNDATLRSRAIYRVPEPRARDTRGSLVAERLSYVYEDQPHDVEAMYVTAYGSVVLITKRRLRDAKGQLRPALLFLLPESAWSERRAAVARIVDSLPLVPGSAPLDMITDAALSRDGKHLAVRTYLQTYIFTTDPLTGRVDHSVSPSVCNVAPLGEPQGEGVTWANDKGRLAFTSEGVGVPIHLGTCPIP